MAAAIKNWDIVYKKAISDKGELFFPERLTKEFLENARRTMGSYIFANQYQNEVIPEDERVFRPEWLQYYDYIPKRCLTFAFIDPAISQEKESDNTGIVIVRVDEESRWYVEIAKRAKLSPTNIVDLCFEIHSNFSPAIIGIEDVAFQKALIYMVNEEMKRRDVIIPISGIRPDPDKSKEMRILSLVPRFEWNRIFINRNLNDFEMEYATFPRGKRDIMDALAYIDRIAYSPQKEKIKDERPTSAADPGYESWYIRNKLREANNSSDNEGY